MKEIQHGVNDWLAPEEVGEPDKGRKEKGSIGGHFHRYLLLDEFREVSVGHLLDPTSVVVELEDQQLSTPLQLLSTAAVSRLHVHADTCMYMYMYGSNVVV